MAVFMPPPGNFIVGPGGYDDFTIGESPTPELLEPSHTDMGEAEAYKKDLVACMTRVWEHESMANTDRWDKIGRAWEQVNNNWTGNPDPGLSDMRLPEGLILDKQVLGILFAMFEQSPNWWELSTKVPSKEFFLNLCRDLVNDHLDNPRCNWWDIVEEGLESMIVTGHVNTLVAVKYGNTLQLGQGAVKGMEGEEEEGQASKMFNLFQPAPADSGKPFVPNEMLPVLHFRNIPTEFCNKDTSGENTYHMWTIDLPVGLAFAQAEKLGFDKQAMLRAKERGYITSDHSNLVTMSRVERPRALDGSSNKLMRFTFHEGDLIDQDTGAQLYSRKYTVMANNCEIVYGPAEIPWWDGEPTIVDAPFLSMAHETYGKGLISENVDTLMMKHVLTNQMLDYLNEAMTGAYEYDIDRIRTEGQRTNLKLHPRAMIAVEGESNAPAVRRIPMGEIATSSWQVAQALDVKGQNATGTAQMGGAPRGRGRITSGEHFAREAQAGALWKLVFRNVQSKWLSKNLRLAFLRLLQSYPQELWTKYVKQKKVQLLSADMSLDPEKAAAWNKAYDECATWSAEKRFEELGSSYVFTVKVFSALMERQARVEKGAFLLRNIPSQYHGELNMREWIRQMVVDLGYDAERILNKASLRPPSVAGPGGPESQGGEDEEIPDVTGGLMGGLPDFSGGVAPQQQQQGGVMPGGPKSQVPGPISPPPGMT